MGDPAEECPKAALYMRLRSAGITPYEYEARELAILVAEDVPALRRAWETGLRWRNGVERVDLVANGDLAVTYATELRYDVMVLDVGLRGGKQTPDGLKALAGIRETPLNASTPAFFLAGTLEQSDIQSITAVLKSPYIHKGDTVLSVEELIYVVYCLLDGMYKRLPRGIDVRGAG